MKKAPVPFPFVYAFRMDSLIKMGCTKYLKTRLSWYRNRGGTLIGVSETFNARWEEKQLIKLLGVKPVKGQEWFRYTPAREKKLKEYFTLINPHN